MNAPPCTVVEVVYPHPDAFIGLRGNHAPLSWDHTSEPTARRGDRRVFQIDVPEGDLLELKIVRDEEKWSSGRNYVVHAGDHLVVEPAFDRDRCRLEPGKTVGDLRYDVLLPPTYDEQTNKRYPVLYALDGQSLWSDSGDPFGVWKLESTLDLLYELGAIEEAIVVGIHTSERRLERLTPTKDKEHGGGEGPALLDDVVTNLRAAVNGAYRTLVERDDTTILGSSLGGLFAFYAAWSRPDVFGKAACLSPSFWWDDRHCVRFVRTHPLPEPRPVLYIDSGAPFHPFEKDPNVRDGFHHTRAMLRALVDRGYGIGTDLHRLVFAGESHNADAWSARVQLPLQLLLPPTSRLRAG